MSTENFPVNLYKTNLELQLRIMQLLQDNRHRWLEGAQQRNTDAMAKTKTEIEGLSQAVGLQSLVTMPTNTAGYLFQTCMSSAQGITRDATLRKLDKANWDLVLRTNLDSMHGGGAPL